MNALYKQNGTKMQVNDSSLVHAKSLGWTELDPSIELESELQVKAEAELQVEAEVEVKTVKKPTKAKAK